MTSACNFSQCVCPFGMSWLTGDLENAVMRSIVLNAVVNGYHRHIHGLNYERKPLFHFICECVCLSLSLSSSLLSEEVVVDLTNDSGVEDEEQVVDLTSPIQVSPIGYCLHGYMYMFLSNKLELDASHICVCTHSYCKVRWGYFS